MDTQTLPDTDVVVQNHKTGMEIVDRWGNAPWYAVYVDDVLIGTWVGQTNCIEHMQRYARNHGINLMEVRRLYLESLQDDLQTKEDLSRFVAKSFAPPRPAPKRPVEKPANRDLQINLESRGVIFRQLFAAMDDAGLPSTDHEARHEAASVICGRRIDSFSQMDVSELKALKRAIEDRCIDGNWRVIERPTRKTLQEAVA